MSLGGDAWGYRARVHPLLIAALLVGESLRPTGTVGAQDVESPRDAEGAAAAMARGREQLAQGNVSEAIAALVRAVELDPENFEAWAGLGAANLGIHQWRGALAAYDRALELSPQDPYLFLGRGRALRGLGDRPAAILAFRRALEIDPASPARAELAELGASPPAHSGSLGAASGASTTASAPRGPQQPSPGGDSAGQAWWLSGQVEAENTAATCRDQRDNDRDGVVDCDDPGCGQLVVCVNGGAENTAAACRDGVDNDADGHSDCDDQDCWDFVFCASATHRSGDAGAGLTDSTSVSDDGAHPLIAVGGILLGIGVIAGAGFTVALIGGEQSGDAEMQVAGTWGLVASSVMAATGVVLLVVGAVLPRPLRRRAQQAGLDLDNGGPGLLLRF